MREIIEALQKKNSEEEVEQLLGQLSAHIDAASINELRQSIVFGQLSMDWREVYFTVLINNCKDCVITQAIARLEFDKYPSLLAALNNWLMAGGDKPFIGDPDEDFFSSIEFYVQKLMVNVGNQAVMATYEAFHGEL